MLLYDANAPAPNPMTVRLFILERGGLDLDVVSVDLINLENRRKAFRDTVNSRGELPALRLDDGRIITEIIPICGYLDDVAKGGRSLFGETPEDRAVTQMWTRRVYLEICQPFVSWWRSGDDAVNFYRGYRVPVPESRTADRLEADTGLNHLDDDLAGRSFICGERLMMADILLYAFMGGMIGGVPWLNPPSRKNVAAWFDRMGAREASGKMMTPFDNRISV